MLGTHDRTPIQPHAADGRIELNPSACEVTLSFHRAAPPDRSCRLFWPSIRRLGRPAGTVTVTRACPAHRNPLSSILHTRCTHANDQSEKLRKLLALLAFDPMMTNQERVICQVTSRSHSMESNLKIQKAWGVGEISALTDNFTSLLSFAPIFGKPVAKKLGRRS